MFSSLLALPSCWERLQQTDKPIVLYGMGNGADRILAIMERHGIPCADFFASDAFVRGHSFHGVRVKTLTEIEVLYGDPVIVVAFAAEDRPTIDHICALAQRHELYVPDLPVVGDVLFDRDFLAAHLTEAERVYALLADERSRQVYLDLMEHKLTGQLEPLMRTESDRLTTLRGLLKPGKDESFFDLGAYNGDTVEEFLTLTGGDFSAIRALEPDARNFKKLTARMEKLGLAGDTRVRLYPLAAWQERTMLRFAEKAGRSSTVVNTGREIPAVSVDELAGTEPVTLLKLDVEGSEREALLGAARTIRRHRPKLLLSAYHLSRDLFALPLLVDELAPGYRFYLRRFPYIPAWEINYICTTAD